jgi:hypothetical protein
MSLRSKLSVSVLATAVAFSVGISFAAANDVKSGDINTIGKSFGRAGGLVGSDRINGLSTHNSADSPLGVSWDAEIAARTNMPADRAAGTGVGVTYDPAIAERTNMPRGTADVQAAGIEGRKAN